MLEGDSMEHRYETARLKWKGKELRGDISKKVV